MNLPATHLTHEPCSTCGWTVPGLHAVGSAALSGSLVTPANGARVAAELRAECDGAHRIIGHGNVELCAALQPCFRTWASLVEPEEAG